MNIMQADFYHKVGELLSSYIRCVCLTISAFISSLIN